MGRQGCSGSPHELKWGHPQNQPRLKDCPAPTFNAPETLFLAAKLTDDIIFVQFMNKEVAFLWSEVLDSGSTNPAGRTSSWEPAAPEAFAHGS